MLNAIVHASLDYWNIISTKYMLYTFFFSFFSVQIYQQTTAKILGQLLFIDICFCRISKCDRIFWYCVKLYNIFLCTTYSPYHQLQIISYFWNLEMLFCSLSLICVKSFISRYIKFAIGFVWERYPVKGYRDL